MPGTAKGQDTPMVDTQHGSKSGLTSLSTICHPLEPLTAEELAAAVALVRKERQLNERVRFVLVTLHEPSKEVVLNFKEGDPIKR